MENHEFKARETYVEFNEDYRMTSDGARNLILSKKYEMRTGKGKNAPLSGEVGYKELYYFGAGLQGLIKRFNELEFLEAFSETERGQDILEAFKDMKKYLDEREQRIYDHVSQYVTLELAKTKEASIDSSKKEVIAEEE